MTMSRLFNVALFFALAVALSRAGLAQARVVSAPPEPSLLNITRQWSRASILGDLREMKTGSNDLELRVWAGYTFAVTTQAVVIRRAAGQWSAFLARVLRCEIPIPRSVGDTASHATMQLYIAEARRHCGVSVKEVSAGMQILATDSLLVERLSVPDSIVESAWNAATRAGALELPAHAEHRNVVDDPLTYVVELRRGNDYRASSIERVDPPESDADRKMRAVYAAVSQLLPPEQRLSRNSY
jgi:hypothetical protein